MVRSPLAPGYIMTRCTVYIHRPRAVDTTIVYTAPPVPLGPRGCELNYQRLGLREHQAGNDWRQWRDVDEQGCRGQIAI